MWHMAAALKSVYNASMAGQTMTVNLKKVLAYFLQIDKSIINAISVVGTLVSVSTVSKPAVMIQATRLADRTQTCEEELKNASTRTSTCIYMCAVER